MFIDTGLIVDPESDFKDIVDLFHLADQLKRFYFELNGLSRPVIKHAEQKANSSDGKSKAMAVLHEWHRRNGPKATREVILQALEKCKFTNAMYKLREKWHLPGE